jgi:hypothetical protein
MTDLWLEASREIEADDAVTDLNLAKMATANIWPFLALAQSEEEFGHRLAIAMDRIERAVPEPSLRDKVISSFAEDYGFYHQGAAEDRADDGGEDDGEHDDEDSPPWEKDASLQVFHAATGKWINVEAAAEPTPGNPQFPTFVPEQGPITGQTGDYPKHPTGADPVDPINQMFPMQPTPWKEIPELWVDRPMNFAPYQNPGNYGKTSAANTMPGHPDHPGHYESEGVETGLGPNPFYFAGGEEGVAGNQQAGFPADVTAPEDREDSRVDFYGAVPPLPSSGSTGDGHPYSNQGNLNTSKESAKDNHGACFDCKQPVYRHGNDWHHLGQPPQNGHSVRLPSDHPWVTARTSSVRHTAPGGGEHAPYEIRSVDGGYAVFNAKGERKNDEPKSKDEARQFQKALYKNVPGASESAEKAASLNHFFAEVSSSDTGPNQGDAGGATPPPPPSMTGGPGSQAMPPMNQARTIPNESVTQNPFPNEPAGGQGGGGAGNAFMGGNPFMGHNIHTANPMTRDRPDMFNPTGVGDEFTERTWEGQTTQSPRQRMEDRNVNTPQRPQEPIHQNTSDGGPRDDEEDED